MSLSKSIFLVWVISCVVLTLFCWSGVTVSSEKSLSGFGSRVLEAQRVIATQNGSRSFFDGTRENGMPENIKDIALNQALCGVPLEGDTASSVFYLDFAGYHNCRDKEKSLDKLKETSAYCKTYVEGQLAPSDGSSISVAELSPRQLDGMHCVCQLEPQWVEAAAKCLDERYKNRALRSWLRVKKTHMEGRSPYIGCVLRNLREWVEREHIAASLNTTEQCAYGD